MHDAEHTRCIPFNKHVGNVTFLKLCDTFYWFVQFRSLLYIY